MHDAVGSFYNFTTENINVTIPHTPFSGDPGQYFGVPLHIVLDYEGQEYVLENGFTYGPDPEVEIIQPLKSITQ